MPPPPSPENLIVPDEVIPVAAAIAPELFTWNKSPLPTVNNEAGDESPIPTLPPASTLILSRPEVPLNVTAPPSARTAVVEE